MAYNGYLVYHVYSVHVHTHTHKPCLFVVVLDGECTKLREVNTKGTTAIVDILTIQTLSGNCGVVCVCHNIVHVQYCKLIYIIRNTQKDLHSNQSIMHLLNIT